MVFSNFINGRCRLDATAPRTRVDHYLDAYNRQDVEGMLAGLHADVVFQNVVGSETTVTTHGLEAFRALAQQSLPLFSERHQQITSFDLHGPAAVATIAFRATVATDLPNGWKAGQELHFTGRTDFEFRDGLIYKITDTL